MRFKLLLLLLFSAFVFTSHGQQNKPTDSRPAKWAQPVTELQVTNMYKIDEGVYRSGQPTKENFSALEKYGINEVLNLRSWHTSNTDAKNTNIKLHRIKMDAHDIDDDEIIEALRIIKNRKGAILIHCKHGSDRTGVVVAMYRIVFQNWSKEDAINELKNGGYGFHSIYSNIPRYIENVNINEIKQQIQ